MKEHPIIFSTEMVKSILEGRKTMTRRVIKPQLEDGDLGHYWWKGDWSTFGGRHAGVIDYGRKGNDEPTWTLEEVITHCPYGQVGDRLIVRESHRLTKYKQDGETWVKAEYRMEVDGDGGVRHFKWADISKKQKDRLARIRTWGKWRPSRFMYRFLARITLEITNIRVERLQEITYSDARAEGILSFNREHPDPANGGVGYNRGALGLPMRYESTAAFMDLWDSLNAKRGYSWESNPFVWVIEFKRQKLIDKNPLNELYSLEFILGGDSNVKDLICINPAHSKINKGGGSLEDFTDSGQLHGRLQVKRTFAKDSRNLRLPSEAS